MIRIPEYLERHHPDGLPEAATPVAPRTRRPRTRGVTGLTGHGGARARDGPHRARLVQGVADLGPGRPGARRRLVARPTRRHDPPLPARRRRRGHARGGRRGRRLDVAGGDRRRPARPADRGPLAPLAPTADRAVIEMAEASGLSRLAADERDAIAAASRRHRRR